MNILHYITWLFSFIRYSNPITTQRNLLNSVENVESNVEDFELITPEYTQQINIFRNLYIDEAINTCSDSEFIIERPGNYGVLYLYMSSDQIDKSLERLYIKHDEDKIYISYNDDQYTWNKLLNVITGPNTRILFHFKNKPYFDDD